MANIDLIQVLIWVLLAIGSAFISVLVWIGSQLGNRLVGIEAQITKTNELLSSIEHDIREDITKIDKRLVVVETVVGGRNK